jgi:PHP family Zn ribbon phosphoesterase
LRHNHSKKKSVCTDNHQPERGGHKKIIQNRQSKAYKCQYKQYEEDVFSFADCIYAREKDKEKYNIKNKSTCGTSLKKGVKEKQEKHRDKQEEKPALQKRWLQQEFIFHVSMLFNFIILMPSRQGRFDQRNWC